MPEKLSFSDSLFVARLPEDLYDLVSDITRMGEWSPICKACWWDEAGNRPARVGAWFTGRNMTADATWDARCQVVVADRATEFAFLVGDSLVRWGYTFELVDGGTLLTESWDFLPAGIASFSQRYGSSAEREIAERTRAAHVSIPMTLAAIKTAAEQLDVAGSPE